MDRSLAQVHEVLQKLVGLHIQLLDSCRLERDALTQANLDELQKVIIIKQSLIESIHHTELLRIKHTQSLATLWKTPYEELTLKNLIILVQGADPKAATQFQTTLNALTILIQRVVDQNSDNKAFIEKSMLHIQKMKANALNENTPKAATYTQQGHTQKSRVGSRFLSKEI